MREPPACDLSTHTTRDTHMLISRHTKDKGAHAGSSAESAAHTHTIMWRTRATLIKYPLETAQTPARAADAPRAAKARLFCSPPRPQHSSGTPLAAALRISSAENHAPSHHAPSNSSFSSYFHVMLPSRPCSRASLCTRARRCVGSLPASVLSRTHARRSSLQRRICTSVLGERKSVAPIAGVVAVGCDGDPVRAGGSGAADGSADRLAVGLGDSVALSRATDISGDVPNQMLDGDHVGHTLLAQEWLSPGGGIVDFFVGCVSTAPISNDSRFRRCKRRGTPL